MTDREISALLEAYVDGDLDDRSARRLADAINARGADCGKILSNLRMTGLLGQALSDVDVDAFVRSFMERYRAEETGDEFVGRIRRDIAGSAPRGIRIPFRISCAIAAGIVAVLAALWIAAPGQRVRRLSETELADRLIRLAPGRPIVAEWSRGSKVRRGESVIDITGGMALEGHDILETGPKQEVTFVYAGEKTRVSLGAETELTIRSISTTEPPGEQCRKRLYLARGNIAADVGRQSKTAGMHIETPHIWIGVVGTQFGVFTDGNSSRLDVAQGDVEARLRDERQAVLVKAGQYVTAGTGVTELYPLWRPGAVVGGMRIVRCMALPVQGLRSLAYDGENLISGDKDGQIWKVDPATGKTDKRRVMGLTGGMTGIAWDGRLLWGRSVRKRASIFAVDLNELKVVKEIKTNDIVDDLAWGAGKLWAGLRHNGGDPKSRIAALYPENSEADGRLAVGYPRQFLLAYHTDRLWVRHDNMILKVRPDDL